MNNLMNAPLPRPVYGNLVPDDVLLDVFWEARSDKNLVLSRLKRSGKTHWTQCPDETKMQFFSFMTNRDQTTEGVQQYILGNSMLHNDSIEMGIGENAQGLRCYGKNGQDEFVVEPRQVCKEVSFDCCRLYDMVKDWRDASMDRIAMLKENVRKKKRIDHSVLAHEHPALKKYVTYEKRLAEKFSQSTDAVLRIALQRFDHAFTSARLQKFIPRGWLDIFKGTRLAIKEVGEQSFIPINPEDPNAAVGTANLAFAFDRRTAATDFSPFGHWRQWQIAMLTVGVAINGPDVRLMLEAYLQAMEVAQEVSTFLLM